MREPLYRVDVITEGTARGFVFGTGSRRRTIFVLRHGGIVRAYHNACPHQGTPLELVLDAFFDEQHRFLVCRTHGARFRPADGFCVDGPCAGRSLTSVPVHVEAEMVVLDDAD